MPNTTAKCRYFNNGQCKFGTSCTFAHDRTAPATCIYFQKGRCTYGTGCRFDHVREKPLPAPNQPLRRGPQFTMKYPTALSTPTAATTSVSIPSEEENKPSGGASFSYATAAGALPAEAKPWPTTLCPYHELGNCPRGAACDLLHGDLCDLCGQNVLHPFDYESRRRHVNECTEAHEKNMQLAFLEQRSQTKQCGICIENIFEKRLRFGILENCRHCFCLDCIREWRSKVDAFDPSNVRGCPECRQRSDYVVPSVVWVEEPDEKELLLLMYKENTKLKPCKYFKPYSKGDCPFGNKCFYRHSNPDGTPAIDETPPGRHTRKAPLLSDFMGSTLGVQDEQSSSEVTEGGDDIRSLVAQIMRINQLT